jgi:hypothetical protein
MFHKAIHPDNGGLHFGRECAAREYIFVETDGENKDEERPY